jgi:hypothetical protein
MKTLSQLIAESKLTNQEVANATGYSASTVSKVRNDKGSVKATKAITEFINKLDALDECEQNSKGGIMTEFDKREFLESVLTGEELWAVDLTEVAFGDHDPEIQRAVTGDEDSKTVDRVATFNSVVRGAEYSLSTPEKLKDREQKDHAILNTDYNGNLIPDVPTDAGDKAGWARLLAYYKEHGRTSDEGDIETYDNDKEASKAMARNLTNSFRPWATPGDEHLVRLKFYVKNQIELWDKVTKTKYQKPYLAPMHITVAVDIADLKDGGCHALEIIKEALDTASEPINVTENVFVFVDGPAVSQILDDEAYYQYGVTNGKVTDKTGLGWWQERQVEHFGSLDFSYVVEDLTDPDTGEEIIPEYEEKLNLILMRNQENKWCDTQSNIEQRLQANIQTGKEGAIGKYEQQYMNTIPGAWTDRLVWINLEKEVADHEHLNNVAHVDVMEYANNLLNATISLIEEQTVYEEITKIRKGFFDKLFAGVASEFEGFQRLDSVWLKACSNRLYASIENSEWKAQKSDMANAGKDSYERITKVFKKLKDSVLFTAVSKGVAKIEKDDIMPAINYARHNKMEFSKTQFAALMKLSGDSKPSANKAEAAAVVTKGLPRVRKAKAE